MEIKKGGTRRGIEALQTYIKHLGEGQIGTSGDQYSAVATFGVAATEILNELIDPSFNMGLKEIELSFTQRFSELVGGTTNASLSYYWEAREEWTDPVGTQGNPMAKTGSWMPLSGTYQKSIASLANSEDTLEGYFPVASLAHAPMRIRLMATGLVASSMKGEVKNDSYVRLMGLVIPGT